eukprot:357916-Chlamydomonas_euryale.AAC.8
MPEESGRKVGNAQAQILTRLPTLPPRLPVQTDPAGLPLSLLPARPHRLLSTLSTPPRAHIPPKATHLSACAQTLPIAARSPLCAQADGK